MEVTLTAVTRTGRGKGPARRARAAGRVPGVLYGHAVESTAVEVDGRQMYHALHTEAGANVLIHLKLESGEEYLTLPREIQRNPIRGDLIHVDFLAVEKDVKIEADVPIHIVGEAPGVKEGGQMDHHIHELKVLALPTAIPPSIEIDVSALAIGDSVRVSDVSTPEGVELLSDPEDLIVAVVEQVELEVPEEVVEPEAATEEGAEAAEGAAPATEAEGESPAEGS